MKFNVVLVKALKYFIGIYRTQIDIKYIFSEQQSGCPLIDKKKSYLVGIFIQRSISYNLDRVLVWLKYVSHYIT